MCQKKQKHNTPQLRFGHRVTSIMHANHISDTLAPLPLVKHPFVSHHKRLEKKHQGGEDLQAFLQFSSFGAF